MKMGLPACSAGAERAHGHAMGGNSSSASALSPRDAAKGNTSLYRAMHAAARLFLPRFDKHGTRPAAPEAPAAPRRVQRHDDHSHRKVENTIHITYSHYDDSHKASAARRERWPASLPKRTRRRAAESCHFADASGIFDDEYYTNAAGYFRYWR